MAGTKTYAGAISSAALQAVSTGTWVAAGALPPGKRRALRAAVMVAGTAIATTQVVRDQKRESAQPQLLETPVLLKDITARADPEPDEPARRTIPPKATVAAMLLSASLAIGGRRIQKHWLARLTQAGHPHPHRALGLRMGLLAAATALPADLLAVAEARRAARSETPPPG
jgi:hypothetical protein